MEENEYISPHLTEFDLYSEGVICLSNDSGIDLNPEEGYM